MKAAFGKISITPESIIGIPMSGYTRQFPALGKLDDIYARAVLIEVSHKGTKSNKIILISLDTLEIPRSLADYLKRNICEKVDSSIKADNILIAAIHTHSAPDMTGVSNWPGGSIGMLKGMLFGTNRVDKYLMWLAHRIITLIKDINTKLIPVKFAWTKVRIDNPIVINRRHPNRQPEQDLGVIAFRHINSEDLIGIIVNFGMHPTTLSPRNFNISADYPGRICAVIENLTKNHTKAVFFTGAAGDLNPITTCGYNFANLAKNSKTRNVVYEQLGTYHHTQVIGNFLGKKALQLALDIPDNMYYDLTAIKTYTKDFWIPFVDQQPYIYHVGNWLSNKFLFLLKRWLILPISMAVAGENAPFLANIIKLDSHSPKYFKQLSYNSINQYFELEGSNLYLNETKKLGIIAVPGELFEELRINLFKKSPLGASDTFLFQNANDTAAYLFPLKEYLTEAGYEGSASLTPGAGEMVKNEMYRLWNNMEKI